MNKVVALQNTYVTMGIQLYSTVQWDITLFNFLNNAGIIWVNLLIYSYVANHNFLRITLWLLESTLEFIYIDL